MCAAEQRKFMIQYCEQQLLQNREKAFQARGTITQKLVSGFRKYGWCELPRLSGKKLQLNKEFQQNK